MDTTIIIPPRAERERGGSGALAELRRRESEAREWSEVRRVIIGRCSGWKRAETVCSVFAERGNRSER